MFKRSIYIVLSSVLILSAQTPDPGQIINQVSRDSIVQYVNDLTGENPVLLDTLEVTINSRYHSTSGNDYAAGYLYKKLNSYGYQPVMQHFNVNGNNVFAEKTGTVNPEVKFIISAHYDCMPSGSPSLGADDDASGCAAVLEAARLFAGYDFANSVIFAFWDEEEIGLNGSTYFAQQFADSGVNIAGVINVEMLGWDSDGDDLIDIHTKHLAGSVPLADTLAEVNDRFGIGLTTAIFNPGTGASDHSSFWSEGYSALVYSQAFFGGDGNPYYHTVNDRIDKFDTLYFEKNVKLGVGALALLAGQEQPLDLENTNVLPGDYSLSQNYPNPFNPSTTIVYELAEAGNVNIRITDMLGREVQVLSEGYKTAGRHAVTFRAENLSSGMYIYTLTHKRFSASRKMILLK